MTMENTPLVSFIVPYFNSGKTIQETIDSIFAQSYPHVEIWIINDGSTDLDSIEKLKDFEGNDKIHIIHQENAGPSVARNKAIRQAKGSIVVPLDADDLMEENVLTAAIEHMTRHPEIAVLYGNLRYFGERQEYHVQEEFSIQKQLIWNQLAVCAFIRKEVFQHLSGYDEHLSQLGLEDWEFWIRVFEAGFSIHKIKGTHFAIRVGSTSRTHLQANPKIQEIRNYVYSKHALLMASRYEAMYYALKMERELPDNRIGKSILAPYRWLKKFWR
jgi:glycosyltransferase involved in cell wall biosynthesis